MATDALSSAERAYAPGRSETRSEEFWTALVGSVDALLRSYHGIYEFTDDPQCVFRIAPGTSPIDVALADGTRIRSGEPVGVLHFWNEHLPPYSGKGPDLGWAADMRRRVRLSLELLADYAERAPAWLNIPAFRADATLSKRLGDVQMRRLAERYGFERIEPPRSVSRRLHAFGDSMNAWALTLAFNPNALARQPLLRGRHDLWISRSLLMQRYERPAGRSGDVPADRTV